MSALTKAEPRDEAYKALLDEAMRRAAREATKGPAHLRAGRFRPTAETIEADARC